MSQTHQTHRNWSHGGVKYPFIFFLSSDFLDYSESGVLLLGVSYTLFDTQSQCLTLAKKSATIRLVLTTSDTVNAFLRQLELRFAAVVQHCRKPLQKKGYDT